MSMQLKVGDITPLISGKHIYKYYSNKAWSYVLPEDGKGPTIRFTPYLETNDPFEGKLHILGIASKQKLKPFFRKNYAEIIKSNTLFDIELSDQYLNRVSDEEFFRFSTTFIPTFKEQLRTQMGAYGIFSVTTDPVNIPMWSYYADDHTGFAIEFDPQHNFFKLANPHHPCVGFFCHVKYTSTVPSGYLLDFINRGEDAYFTKSSAWKHEDEVRMALNISSDPDYFSHKLAGVISIDPAAIQKIIFGCRTVDEDMYKKVVAIQNYPQMGHVKFAKIIQNQDNYALQLKDL